MNDFKSYSNAKANGTTAANTNNQTNKIPGGGGTPIDGNNRQSSESANKISDGGSTPLNNTVEMAKIISKAMNGKSTAQIMQTIISEAERGKRDGTLTNADLDNFYNALSPLLDGAKKRKLKQVIENLKNI